jgi:hypothetical protein
MTSDWYYRIHCQYFEKCKDPDPKYPRFDVIDNKDCILRNSDTDLIYNVFKLTDKKEIFSHTVGQESFGFNLRDSLCRITINEVVVNGVSRNPTGDELYGFLFGLGTGKYNVSPRSKDQ